MDHQREAFRRLSAQDEGMMESPHGTPVKKVRRQTRKEVASRLKIVGEIPSTRICAYCSVSTAVNLEANFCMRPLLLVFSPFVHPSVYSLLTSLLFFFLGFTGRSCCRGRRAASPFRLSFVGSERTYRDHENNPHAAENLLLTVPVL